MNLSFLIICFSLIIFIPISQVYGEYEDKLVVINTPSGNLVIEFFPNEAPKHVENFVNLTQNGFYDRTIFHRIIKDFMIQGGDPKTKPGAYTKTEEWGTGGPGYSIDAEFNDIKHTRGIVSMARSADPNSAGSQFFIVHKNSTYLDGQYTVFGRLATQESYETLDKIANLETPPNVPIAFDWGKGEILKAEVVNKSDVPNILSQGDPERTDISIPERSKGIFTSERYGFSYAFPEGWLIQEPEKTNPSIPDVAAIGPRVDGINPTISISIKDSEGKSLEMHVEEFKETLKEALDSGQLEILSEEKTKLGGFNAHSIITKGVFISQEGAYNIKFKEFTIEAEDKFYVITYANNEKNFEMGSQDFDEAIKTFKINSEKNPEDNGLTDQDGGCLIATATFGSELAPQVQKLREIRDTLILNSESGKTFMENFNHLYYIFSPSIADLERQNPVFKEAVKISITPLLYSLNILSYIDSPSEEKILGFGIGVILLNLGFYFGLPAFLFLGFKKFHFQK